MTKEKSFKRFTPGPLPGAQVPAHCLRLLPVQRPALHPPCWWLWWRGKAHEHWQSTVVNYSFYGHLWAEFNPKTLVTAKVALIALATLCEITQIGLVLFVLRHLRGHLTVLVKQAFSYAADIPFRDGEEKHTHVQTDIKKDIRIVWWTDGQTDRQIDKPTNGHRRTDSQPDR